MVKPAKKIEVPEATVKDRLVVVAAVPVAFRKVKFCRVVELVTFKTCRVVEPATVKAPAQRLVVEA